MKLYKHGWLSSQNIKKITPPPPPPKKKTTVYILFYIMYISFTLAQCWDLNIIKKIKQSLKK